MRDSFCWGNIVVFCGILCYLFLWCCRILSLIADGTVDVIYGCTFAASKSSESEKLCLRILPSGIKELFNEQMSNLSLFLDA